MHVWVSDQPLIYNNKFISKCRKAIKKKKERALSASASQHGQWGWDVWEGSCWLTYTWLQGRCAGECQRDQRETEWWNTETRRKVTADCYVSLTESFVSGWKYHRRKCSVSCFFSVPLMQHTNSKIYFKIVHHFKNVHQSDLGEHKEGLLKKKMSGKSFILSIRACEEENSPFCKCYDDVGRIRCDQNKSMGWRGPA